PRFGQLSGQARPRLKAMAPWRAKTRQEQDHPDGLLGSADDGGQVLSLGGNKHRKLPNSVHRTFSDGSASTALQATVSLATSTAISSCVSFFPTISSSARK